MGRAARHLWLSWLGLVLLTSGPAAAAPSTPRVGVRVLGAPTKTASPLAEALRARVVELGAELVSTADMRETERKLKLPKRKREESAALVETARAAGATHLLVVRLKPRGGQLTAKIQFFETDSGELRTKGTLRWNRTPASARRLAGPLVERLLAPLLAEAEAEPEAEVEAEPEVEAEATVATTPTTTPTTTEEG